EFSVERSGGTCDGRKAEAHRRGARIVGRGGRGTPAAAAYPFAGGRDGPVAAPSGVSSGRRAGGLLHGRVGHDTRTASARTDGKGASSRGPRDVVHLSGSPQRHDVDEKHAHFPGLSLRR